MRRLGLILLAGFMIVGLARCGGGGADSGDGPDPANDPLNLNGTWLVAQRQVWANCPWTYDTSFQVVMVQVGSAMTVEGAYLRGRYPGEFNPDTGIFKVKLPYPSGVHGTLEGSMTSNDTFLAYEHDFFAGCTGDFEWRGELLSR